MQIKTEQLFSERINNLPKSFIREILKVTAQPDVISFAGGLPNPNFFPVDAIKAAAVKVLTTDGASVLQYGVSEGYLPLREYIAGRYLNKGLTVSPEEILITNGSQQALDLLGKVFINDRDKVLLERPSYIGAIQAFSAYQPEFLDVKLNEDGVDINDLEDILAKNSVKMFYSIPNFQNPSGISWSNKIRLKVAHLIKSTNSILVEDDPYGEIKFVEEEYECIKSHIGDQGVLLGSFSKVIAPGMRLGWVVARKAIIEKLLLAKQASDLHSNNLAQRTIYQYLLDNDLEKHLKKIKEGYCSQKNSMIKMMEKYFPKGIRYTNPNGGMFIWVTLPEHLSSYDVLSHTMKKKIVFVPGEIFFKDSVTKNNFRLNFSNSNEQEMERGLRIIGEVLQELI